MSPPEGTLTFFFTDVEGSTRMASELGDERWVAHLEAHRALIRGAVEAHAGHEVDTQGDAFFAVFRRASDGVGAAIAAQRALAGHDWPDAPVRVRIGLHTGEATLRDGNYAGQEVHRASRIGDAGHGGQIVLSQATADLARDGLAAGLALRDLGFHRLKGLDEPVRLHQLDADGLATDFPALRTLPPAYELPTERSSFVGREKEIESLRARLAAHRLVTLTGIGGAGKTRLALRAAALASRDFPDGACFVDLAPVSDPERVAHTVASALGIVLLESPGMGGAMRAEDRLAEALAQRAGLVLLDNCEHLIDAVADLVDLVLETCPQITVLATSREALAVEGEQVMRVPSLSVPDDAAHAADSEAVALFVERARAVKPGFALDAETTGPVIEICRRLDGIPLAIEFAGARVAHLSPRQVADRLEDRFRLLTGGRRRIQRQQTLAAALDWSHDMLDAPEKALFRRLAVFAGSFGIDAVEAICQGEDLDDFAVLDTLGSLVAKSLVGPDAEVEGAARYRLLESVRAYAAERLVEAGESEGHRTRHRDWYVEWMDAIPLEALTFAPDDHPATTCELENIRAAADWAQDAERADLVLRLIYPLHFFWSQRGEHEEGTRRARAVLECESALTTEQAADAHALIGGLENLQLSNEDAIAHADRAIELLDGQARPALVIALSLRAFSCSVTAAFEGLESRHVQESRAFSDRGVEIARALPPEWRAWAEFWRGMCETNIGDFEESLRWYRALAETAEKSPYRQWLYTTPNAGQTIALHLLGRDEQALDVARALVERDDSRGRWSISNRLDGVPSLIAGGDVDEGRAVLRQEGRRERRSGVPLAANHVFVFAAAADHLEGRFERAGQLLGAARTLGDASAKSIPFRTPASMSLYRSYLPKVREALGPEAAKRARDAGRAWSIEEAWEAALS